MQGKIMKNRLNAVTTKPLNERVPLFFRRHQGVEHVIRLLAMLRHVGQRRSVGIAPAREPFKITFREISSMSGDPLMRFELCAEKSREHIREYVAGTHVDPRVLVHLSSNEPASIRSFFSYDLGALDVSRIVDQQCSAFAAGEILCLVKAQRCQRTERSTRD